MNTDMNTDQMTFKRLWGKFIARLKGKMLRQVEKGTLDIGALKLMLLDASAGWDSDEEEGGRWLHGYAQEHPEKGELLRNTLVEDMRFTEITSPRELPQTLEYILPVGGAAVGLGLSSFFQASWKIKAAATIGPGMLLYPAVKAVGEGTREKNRRAVIEGYLGQLDKFKESVLSLLAD